MLKKDHPEYQNWSSMKSRTYKYAYNARYAHVDMDPRWLDFYVFLADMGPKPGSNFTVDRLDRSKGYWPGNCRWATRSDQQVNRATPKNNTTGYRGVSYRKADNCYRVNICYRGNKIEINGFKTPHEAALAYNKIAAGLHGTFAQLNTV